MLEIQVPYRDGDVVSIKLSSGEEMIATLVKESTTEVVVSRPRMLAAGEKGMILAPYMFTVNPDAKYALRLNSVICVCKTEEATAKSYSSQTSGIVVI
tara:strand:+ start:26225 stop:26518 length:294 start_codon:yes stop_codon:yes gene_type:complete